MKNSLQLIELSSEIKVTEHAMNDQPILGATEGNFNYTGWLVLSVLKCSTPKSDEGYLFIDPR